MLPCAFSQVSIPVERVRRVLRSGAERTGRKGVEEEACGECGGVVELAFFFPLLLCSCSLPCWFDLLFHMPLRFLLLMPPARCFLPLSFLLLTASSRSTLSERSKQRERRNSRKKERGIEKTSLPLRILEGLFRRKGGREGRRKKKPETHLFFPSFPVLSASILSTTPRSRTSARATSASPS